MSYLVLARRFRPQTFASIVGQEHISRALMNAISRGKIAHALLFTGPRGVGKTTTARVLARALNCTGRVISPDLPLEQARESVEPCGSCSNCREIAQGNSLACREIDGASNNSVENVRELIESLRTLPPPGTRYKIYLVDEVHMFSGSAFNALLKSLEEPPPNTIFIFATTDPHKIPETVISRCQQFDFRRLDRRIIVENLKQIASGEGISADEEVFNLIARKAEGGMRDAQSLLDRLLAFSEERLTLHLAQEVTGVVDATALAELARAILESQPSEALNVLKEIFSRSLDLRGFIGDFIRYFRSLLLLKLSRRVVGIGDVSIGDVDIGLDIDGDWLSEMKTLIKDYESFDLQRIFQLAQEIGDRALISNYPRYVMEAGVVRMAQLPSLRPVAEIIQSLNNNASSFPTIKSIQPVKESAITGTEEKEGTFDPSWVGFVSFVQSSGNPMVAQFLRRVTARQFVKGRLEIEGTTFDIGALKDGATMDSLKKALAGYAPGQRWEITFTEIAQTNSDSALKSLAAQEEQTKRTREEQVKKDVQDDPLIQAALATFEGSAIERIQTLK